MNQSLFEQMPKGKKKEDEQVYGNKETEKEEDNKGDREVLLVNRGKKEGERMSRRTLQRG